MRRRATPRPSTPANWCWVDSLDCVVVGAGVIGLAVARAVAQQGRSVLIAERESAFGTIISARNSEVIHAGIYYPQGSLKARLCVQGREQLYAYCAARGIAHRRTGKWIVATEPEQLAQLEGIAAAARANGVELEHLDVAAARRIEPALRAAGVLVSPLTGIVDSHAYMLALLGEAEDAGATLALRSTVREVQRHGRGLQVAFADGYRVQAQWLINCAGLDAPALASRIEGLPAAFTPTAHYAKGCYFSLQGKAPFSRLIYPVPEPGGLGVHLTLDLAGSARFGPDVQWVAAPDYSVDAARAERFYPVIRRYWPGLPDGALLPAYAGVRPKISGPNEAAADFRIEGPAQHGVAGVVNLFGIESPGLTASLAIADLVAKML